MAKIVNEIDFNSEVLSSNVPVLVDFFATWCGPCKMVAPSIEEISNEMMDSLKVVKIDVDQSVNLARDYDIRSVPTFMVFKNGQAVDKIIGAVPKSSIVSRINNIL